MYYLILDTSSPRGLFAILKDYKILLKQEVAFGVRESNELVPVIEMGLKQLRLEIDEVSTLILSKGPGSFTGLRIGASVAKALSFAKDIPIRTVDSLKCFDPVSEGSFAVLLDAKAKGIYVQKGLKEKQEIYYEDKSFILSLDQLNEALSQVPTLVTAQKSSFKNKLDEANFSKLTERTPDATQMLKMAFKTEKTSHHNPTDILDLQYFNSP